MKSWLLNKEYFVHRPVLSIVYAMADDVVYKFPVTPSSTPLEILHRSEPVEAIEPLAIGVTNDQLVVWMRMRPGRVRGRKIYVVGTGWEVPAGAQYVDTCVDSDGLVWHLFDGGVS